MSEKLTPLEEAFVAEYANTGNGTKSYLAVRPKLSLKSAETSASRMLRNVRVQEALQQARHKVQDKSLPTRPEVLKRFVEYADGAEKEKQYGSAVNSMREFAKIEGLYSEPDSPDGYIKVLQTMININNTQINLTQQTKKEES